MCRLWLSIGWCICCCRLSIFGVCVYWVKLFIWMRCFVFVMVWMWLCWCWIVCCCLVGCSSCRMFLFVMLLLLL